MKFCKILICALFFFHILSSFFVNINIISVFKKKETYADLNTYGKSCVDYISNVNGYMNKDVYTGMYRYLQLIGSERGFEFYSPNAPQKDVKLFFLSQNEDVYPKGKSFEAEFKMKNLFNILGSRIADKKFRENLIHSVSKRISTLNSSINDIEIYFQEIKTKRLKEIKKNEPTFTKKKYIVYKIKLN
jgi:hypothetical protein